MTFGSLFAGAGGFDVGFQQAGMTRLWDVELMRGSDIRNESAGTLQRVDLVCGGPPCQRTSYAASFHGQRDSASLWPEMLRIVNALRPGWVVVEQPHGGVAIIEQAAKDLQRIGYGCAGRVIDSRHWLPQTRSRWFLVGRMGVSGMDLWDRLYPRSERVEGQDVQGRESSRFAGDCPDCVSGGIYSRISARKLALIGAGNAVSPPVARWLGERIIASMEGK